MKLKKILSVLLLGLFGISLASCKPEELVVYELDTRYTDELTLTIPFEEKNFLDDGIEEVQLDKVIDGDTITVKELKESVRFLGIDAPESTSRIEPWGMPAAVFVREKLTSADSIVIQSEGSKTDNYDRYLAWVWYKPVNSGRYRLLNLEVIENAYSRFTLGDTMFYDIFLAAHEKTELTEKGVFGEKNDPDFEYSRVPVQTTIAEALANHDKYKLGTKFFFRVQIARIVGENLFVRDVEETDIDGKMTIGHIYVYTGPGANYSNHLSPGDIITLEAQLQYEGQFGTQLTGIKGITPVGKAELDIQELDAKDLTDGGFSLEPYYGQVVKINNLTLVNIRRSANDVKKNYFNLEFKNDAGKIISVRLAADKSQYLETELIKNSKYSVIGGISSYEFATGYYQVVVGEKDKTIVPDLKIN